MTQLNISVEYKDPNSLTPYPNNARVHPDEQITQIAGSIKELGFVNPVLLDNKDGIIAGHGRIEAAKFLKMEKVPCINLDHLSERQKRMLILADNKTAENARWDMEMLKIELDDLIGDGVDVGLIGFSEDEMAMFTEDWSEDEDVKAIEPKEADFSTKITIKCDQDQEPIIKEQLEKIIEEQGLEDVTIS